MTIIVDKNVLTLKGHMYVIVGRVLLSTVMEKLVECLVEEHTRLEMAVFTLLVGLYTIQYISVVSGSFIQPV